MTLIAPSPRSTPASRPTRGRKPTKARSSTPAPSLADFRPPRFESPQAVIDGKLPPTFGPIVARWIEANLVHGEGDALGEPIKLLPFQRYILNRKYEYDPKTGRLLYDRCLFGLAKGNSKTELMAADALAELAGPIAPLSPNVVVSASSWLQANRLFGAARLMIEEGPLADTFRDSLFDDRIVHPERQGVLSRIAAIAGSNDGGLPTAHYGDEVHEWDGERRERVYVVLGNGLKKRSPRATLSDGRVRIGGQQVGITTAGDDPNGLLRKLYDHGRKVAALEVKDPRYLFLWWEADERLELEKPDQFRTAVLQANPAAGGFLPYENLVERFADPTLPRHEFERYHLNRWVSAPDAWISLDVWMERVHKTLRWPPKGARVWLGFDGSKSRDSTALVGCTEDGHIFVIKVWERDLHVPDWTVSRTEVDAAVDKAFKRWDVQLMQCDPPRWEREVEDWTARYGVRVMAFDTAVYERMAPAVGRFEDAVIDKKMTHDGDPTLARHVANARRKEVKWGYVIEKEHKDSPRRIDSAVAAVLAHDGISAPIEAQQSKRMYSW